MIPEAQFEATETGLVQVGPGWFVVSAREARWRYAESRGAVCPFGDKAEFAQIGVKLYVLATGEAMAMYHWESNQEDFLVLAGRGLLLIEGQKRPLRKWDLVHCPPQTKHTILGVSDELCVVLGIGARERHDEVEWGGYVVDELAMRYSAGVAEATSDVNQAYAAVPRRRPVRAADEWLT